MIYKYLNSRLFELFAEKVLGEVRLEVGLVKASFDRKDGFVRVLGVRLIKASKLLNGIQRVFRWSIKVCRVDELDTSVDGTFNNRESLVVRNRLGLPC